MDSCSSFAATVALLPREAKNKNKQAAVAELD